MNLNNLKKCISPIVIFTLVLLTSNILYCQKSTKAQISFGINSTIIQKENKFYPITIYEDTKNKLGLYSKISNTLFLNQIFGAELGVKFIYEQFDINEVRKTTSYMSKPLEHEVGFIKSKAINYNLNFHMVLSFEKKLNSQIKFGAYYDSGLLSFGKRQIQSTIFGRLEGTQSGLEYIELSPPKMTTINGDSPLPSEFGISFSWNYSPNKITGVEFIYELNTWNSFYTFNIHRVSIGITRRIFLKNKPVPNT